ncbi:hypothetical protein RYX36_008995 [Vicia faba]
MILFFKCEPRCLLLCSIFFTDFCCRSTRCHTSSTRGFAIHSLQHRTFDEHRLTRLCIASGKISGASSNLTKMNGRPEAEVVVIVLELFWMQITDLIQEDR